MLNDLISVYKGLSPLSSLAFDHYWIKASQVLKIPALRVISAHDYPRDEHRNYMGTFLDLNRMAAVFPLSFFGIFTGFGFRSLSEKNFSLVKRHSFSCYTTSKAFDAWKAGKLKWNTPFIMAEDVISAEVMATKYPFCFAYTRSAVSENLAFLISLFTTRVILVPDRDPAGIKGYKRSESTFRSRGVSVYKYDPPARFNDMGDIFKAALRGEDVRKDLATFKQFVCSLN